jgi:hypothetical protein
MTVAVVIALAAVLGWIFSGRALRPVHQITTAARAASGHNNPDATPGVLHAYCLGCLRDPESRAADLGNPSRKSVDVGHRSVPR